MRNLNTTRYSRVSYGIQYNPILILYNDGTNKHLEIYRVEMGGYDGTRLSTSRS